MSLTKLNKSPVLSKANLEEYQHRGVEFIKSHPNCALWVDCGLGKTATTMAALGDHLQVCMVHKVLVVAPKKVTVETWPDELKKWSGLFSFPVQSSLIVGTPKQRVTASEKTADIYLVNIENLVWLIKKYGQTWPWDCVILDESSKFKDGSTKRFKALKSVLSKITTMIQLTGTPAPNGLMGLWAQIFLLDRGERLGRTITGFRRKYFDAQRRGEYTEYTIKEGAEEEIYELVSDVVFRLDGDDYLKMDPIKNVHHRVTLPNEAVEFYQQLVRDLIVELEDSDQVVTAINKAVLTNKLLQCANGAVYVDESETGEWKHIHDEKLDILEHIINETGSPVLVAYNFKHDLVRLRERFPDAVDVKETNAVERWNRGEIPILLAHPASAGHGLNLQAGGHVMVWFGLNWSLELYQQFNARLRRKGQTKPVICHHLIAEDTVDEKVLDALDGKDLTQSALLDALKEQVKK